MAALFARIISTGIGIGYFPKAPGTMGSLATIIIFWFCPDLSLQLFLFFCAIITLVGIIASSITEKEFQQKHGDNNLHDPGIIIIDEVAGMMVALIAIPKTLPMIIGAFVLFRFFDIVKPFPINKVEKLPSGLGIMSDDILAGIFSNIILQIIVLIF